MGLIAAGIVLFRRRPAGLEILLGHLGGPFFARKDLAGWTVPKGLIEPGESLIDAARREWQEETGLDAPLGDYLDLPSIRQSGSKRTWLFLVEGDADPTIMQSNLASVEWPPRSGKRIEVPEIDRFAWVDLELARNKFTLGLAVLVDHVAAALEQHYSER